MLPFSNLDTVLKRNQRSTEEEQRQWQGVTIWYKGYMKNMNFGFSYLLLA